jgi:hypothetical protein
VLLTSGPTFLFPPGLPGPGYGDTDHSQTVPSGAGAVEAEGELVGAGQAVHGGSGPVEAEGEVVGAGQAVHYGSGPIEAEGLITGDGQDPAAAGGAGPVVAEGAVSGAGYVLTSGAGTVEGIGATVGAGYVLRSGSGPIEAEGELVGDGSEGEAAGTFTGYRINLRVRAVGARIEDVHVYEGEDVTLAFALPYAAAGKAFSFAVRDGVDGSLLFLRTSAGGHIVADPDDDDAALVSLPAATLDVTPGRYYYSLARTDAGYEKELAAGRFSVSASQVLG